MTTESRSLAFTHLDSPVGRLKLVASPQGLAAVLWQNDRPTRVRLGEMVEDPNHPHLRRAITQLNEYFSRRRTTFDLPLDPRGTPFQQQVWDQLLAIPYGETRSYLDLARKLGNPNATRAVGAANGRNPISIIVPCHRVIGSSGSLTGFAGGLEIKQRLLHLESGTKCLFP
ncbi:MAG TPA: methylated-DNA--[protein]-cysteine S-methyltransferase [Acidobacteriaceae bacterium]|jgi:methylated-DNA-[protein]-cysteine S-methyltransferase|nr:methylated-DNA--[protein]-cysteine S-methyltransferase [Acidobacteriaceae bacterium]